LVLVGVNAFFICDLEVLDGSNPSGPVHTDTVIEVIDLIRVQPRQRCRVNIISKGAPKDLSLLFVLDSEYGS
jgi:hypothetical protein